MLNLIYPTFTFSKSKINNKDIKTTSLTSLLLTDFTHFSAFSKKMPLRKKCPYSEFFCSIFSRIWTEYGEILRISLYSVRMRRNMDQKNSEYGHFSSSVPVCSLPMLYHCFSCLYSSVCALLLHQKIRKRFEILI